MSNRSNAEKANVEAIYPLGPAQRGMLYYSVVRPEETAYQEQLRTRLKGDLDTAALRRAWQLVVDRHQTLRSQFAWEHRDKPLQVIRREVELPWSEHDVSDLPRLDAEDRIQELLRDDLERGLTLDKAPILRVAVVKEPDDHWSVIWTFHHILLDGWSIGLVQTEVWTAYRAFSRGEEPDLPEAPSLRGWIAWLAARDDEADRSFWQSALAGLEDPWQTGFPGGRETGAVATQGEVRSVLEGDEVKRLTSFARHHGLTFNAVAVGAWALVLRRYTGRSKVAFGMVAAGRPPELPGIERTAGVFMNALPSYNEVPPEARVVDWLQGLQERFAELRDHAGRSMEDIQEWTGLPVREPIFDTLFVFENYPTNPEAVTDLGVELLGQQIRERGAIPVSLYLTPRADELVVWLDYRRNKLGDEAARTLLGHYLTLLRALTAQPEARLADLPMLSKDERARLLGEWADGGALPDGAGATPVHRRFAEIARRSPDRPAVIDGERSVPYGELAASAGAVAAKLRDLGVGTDDRVVLLARRSPEMLAGTLGILGAGAAYVPIDPKTPEDRIAFVVEDAGAAALVLQGDVPVPETDLPVVRVDELPDGDASALEAAPVLPESAAYVIYTSGSTGRPKGVVVSHRNLDSYVASAAETQAIEPGTRVLQFASIGFDTSAEEIWPCLTRGGTLVLRDDRALGGPEELGAALAEWRPEVLDLPTAFWHEMAAMVAAGELELPESVRLVILGGEKALGERLADWRRGLGTRAPEIRIENTYGPTETTIVATAATITPTGTPDGGEDGEIADPPIGRAVPGARAYVLGSDLRVLPYGVAGELVIGGAGVARGYLGRPGLTAERFVPDPSGETEGGRLYRTGDLVAWGEDGRLEFRGRIDDQVKIRGFRVEPGEVAAVLATHPSLRDAAVVPWSPAERPARSDGTAKRDLRLAAYLVAAAGREVPRPGELRDFVGERLPEYMVPSVFMALSELPRTPSGKLDRRALPEPENLLEDRSVFSAPRTPTEEVLAGWWSEMLGTDRISRDDDFFRLGGHSLLVGRLAARVRKELGADLPMIEVFDHPVLHDLAARIEAAEAGEADAASPLPPLEVVDRSGPLPLSYQQERVWFLNNLVPNNTAYNFQVRFWLRGKLDVPALERSLTEIVRRQEVFRTTFPEVDGAPVQVIHEPWPVELPITDISHLEGEAAERRAEEILEEEVAKTFDVTELPLIRWRLVKVGEEDHQLIQVEHHFVHDGWSVSIVLTELKALYKAYAAGEESPLEDLPIQYGDFAVWQRTWMRGEAMDRIAGYWRRKLEGAPSRLDMPADRPRPSRMTLAGDAIREFLPKDIYRGLREFGRREGFTLYMTMMAAFQTLVFRHTGQEDFLIGTGIANRRLTDLEPIVGMMVNSLVIRGELEGNPTFRELLERVRGTTLEAYAHQDMPFERLVEEIQPERDASRNPLFQVMFSFHDAAVPDLEFEDLRIGFLVEHNHTAKTDLNVVVAPRAEQRVGRASHEKDDLAMVTWEFSTDLYDKARIRRLIDHYYRVVRAALANPDLRVAELPVMTEEEEGLVTSAWTGEATGYPRDLGLAELFARQAAATPEQPAVRFGGEELSFAELDRRSAAIAARLAEAGVGRGTPVALAAERSLELVPTIVGIVRAGGCYVPLDASYPKERIAYMLADSGARVLVADDASRERLGDAAADLETVLGLAELASATGTSPEIAATGDDAAYVIYTSGSTGQPKGVVVPQRAVSRLVLEADFATFGPDHTFLQLAPISFDAATLEIWAPLLTGGTLVVFPAEAPTLESLGETLASEGVTTLWLTAGLFHQMVDGAVEALAPLRQLLAGGDVLSPAHCRRVLEAHPELTLVNGYGPTENTTFTACHVMESPDDVGDPVPLGRPIADTRVMILDPNLRPVPTGIAGELVAGGDGLARGYRNSPALTAERFVPDPFAGLGGRPEGERIYRTGDLARWLPSGDLEFLGRIDHQVKVRGFRIEPGEVEAALRELPAVSDVRVLAVEMGGEKALAAFVVASEDSDRAALEPAAVRSALTGRLPAHMVPAAVTVVEGFPLTPNGKVDRKKLVASLTVGASPEGAAEHVEPRTETEKTLVAIWTDLLPVDRVGVKDDFFDLGGHSLTATRMLSRIRRELDVQFPLAVIFEEPTIERLARVVDIESGAAADEEMSDAELDALLGGMLAKKDG